MNPITLQLKQHCLIEASAGTGKTYTLVILYLRLLLGIGGLSAYHRPLSITEILLVTFTEAAIKEIRSRIHDTIHRLRISCVCGYSNDPLLAALLLQIKNIPLAINQLLAAEQQINEAAIFTIHGFCQRMLNINYNLLESSFWSQKQLLEDDTHLLQQVVTDFWRRYCSPLPDSVARIVQQYWTGPDQLLTSLLPYLHNMHIESIIVSDQLITTASIIDHHNKIINYIDALKKQWLLFMQQWSIFIQYIPINGICKKTALNWKKKISIWANKLTVDYAIPIELERLNYLLCNTNTLPVEIRDHLFFKELAKFYLNYQFSLQEFILRLAINEIIPSLEKEKNLKNIMSFHDLLKDFDNILTSNHGEIFANFIRSRYPVAMIDEFQDIDPLQYRIFKRLYDLTKNTVLLLIGDPKQAIYSFRGADIFTYIHARKLVKECYTLDTNWRSAPGMVNAVNQLFQSLPIPFIFSEIPFKPAVASAFNSNLQFMLDEKAQPAMLLWLQASNNVGVAHYQKSMAHQCAATISYWLRSSNAGLAWLESNKGRKQLQASDIVVLVRNRDEAALINDAMTALSIKSVYVSSFSSVFQTIEAREIMCLLQAIVEPEQHNKLRCALATSLLGGEVDVIESFNINEKINNKWRGKFNLYHKIWQQHGILPMLRHIIIENHIAEFWLSSYSGERCITNVLHLGELLQQASVQFDNEYALVRWLSVKITDPNDKDKNQQLWLENHHNLVHIITIHKSKGLEFPLVLLPFASNFRSKKHSMFHDRQLYPAGLDLSIAPNSMNLTEDDKRLAEDLRLLYVAVTRSIYHCCIGIAPIYHGYSKITSTSDLHLSALGYLIQQGNAGNAIFLRSQLEKLLVRAEGDISLCEINKSPLSHTIVSIPVANLELSARHLPINLFDRWQITSYTELQKNTAVTSIRFNDKAQQQLYSNINVDLLNHQQYITELTQHTFPCGKLAGKFLHSIFETIDFSKQIDSTQLSLELTKHNIDQCWLLVLQQWLHKVITAPLNNSNLSLSKLDHRNYCTELPFLLPINTTLRAQDMDKLCKNYDPLSLRCPTLDFTPVKGMLTGVIDLVFCWQNRYYLLDYKSNRLGEDSSAYTKEAIEQAMIQHRYELQYQLYTLALHRYMRHRLVNYDYQRDFGGIFYLFIRGIELNLPIESIYTYRPDISLINKLDQMFNGKM
ncbi:exodeoxyribonuclease V subunit beta [Candidatus Palibaumannia cicadellinicola]|uniref:RecBCD enzyme subunit RecB n=1 Tax=Baumannia cicadellinicola subsp. Homalodisca coagulata TaxID=374463 RepID=Q1LST8_BAUCH|nr:exodeoxyribonuclease V subunit beta [Candidatus Baumannia cicadellinicola]ABF13913.1 exodeoxyribonuclease V, beta subunit [Baumannia cicadellinicola str. Hc (Homalodisca coagulata)]MCJ7462162.1 exodeoxyribonuclease V subunit beta [Candidatus Baumannia cicadellinicola]MCJ7463012.1 exodeoxyribonuclease V subunit beta [Candidatus Baumannia cicadellinicola]